MKFDSGKAHFWKTARAVCYFENKSSGKLAYKTFVWTWPEDVGIIWTSHSEFQIMQSLESSVDREEILKRIGALTAADQRRWGKMSVNQMVCHLCDSYRLALGEKKAGLATGFLQRTAMKWFALWVPLKWPKGVATLPEVEQGKGGTPPAEFEADRASLVSLVRRFCDPGPDLSVAHPFFDRMSRKEWLRWGYLHADHHLRQFGR
jgi:hypothetical protein